jgi:hypothetical protein
VIDDVLVDNETPVITYQSQDLLLQLYKSLYFEKKVHDTCFFRKKILLIIVQQTQTF